MKKLLLLFLLLVWVINLQITNALTPVMCTEEAKLCPDGKTWVWRTWPSCQFSECPNIHPVENKRTISIKLQRKIDNLLSNFFNKLDDKFWPQTEKKVIVINKIILKVSKLKTLKPKHQFLLNYMQEKLEIKVTWYKDTIFNDIRDIVN